MRPSTKGPRSVIRMAPDCPVCRLVTTISDPMGSVRCAAVMAWSLKTCAIGRVAALVGRGVPGGVAFLAIDGPMRGNVLAVFGAHARWSGWSRRNRAGRVMGAGGRFASVSRGAASGAGAVDCGGACWETRRWPHPK